MSETGSVKFSYELVEKELATIYHFPDSRYNTIPNIQWIQYKVLPPPPNAPTTGVILCRLYPQDKNKNAEGRRAPRQPVLAASPPAPAGMAPLLQQILRQYAATGLPPAYLPKLEKTS